MSKNIVLIFGGVALLVIIGLVVGLPAITGAGTASQVPQVGIFVMDHMVEAMELFQEDMARRGYVDGENINYQVWMFEQEDLPDAGAVANLDLIVALEAGDNVDEPLGRAAELTNNEVPIVFLADNTFPLEGGYIENLTRPGGNVTGVMETVADGRRLELFMEMLPAAKRILVPYDASEPDAEDAIEELQKLAVASDVELVPLPLDEIESYVADYDGDIDAIFNLRAHDIIADLIAFSQAQQLPISADGTNVDVLDEVTEKAYFLMEYYADEASMSVHAAGIAEQILDGADPANIRVENSTSLLTINLARAEELGIEIPERLLEQANEIIRSS